MGVILVIFAPFFYYSIEMYKKGRSEKKPQYPWFHWSEFCKCITFGAVLEFCKRKAMAAVYPFLDKYVKD